jgi:hypothetical protein
MVVPPVHDGPDSYIGQPYDPGHLYRGGGVVGPGEEPQGVPPELLYRVPAHHGLVLQLAHRQVPGDRDTVHRIPSHNIKLREYQRLSETQV